MTPLERRCGPGGVEVRVAADYDELCATAAWHFVDACGRAVEARGRCSVALSGGSTPRGLYRRLAVSPWAEAVDWERCLLLWGDERWVPPDHPDSNFGMARRELIDRLGLPARCVVPMPAGVGDPQSAARAYETTLAELFEAAPPRIDLVLLGLGADGHTASLFPGSPLLEERDRWVAVAHDRRLTLTLPVLRAAREVLFLVSGKDKAEAVARALEEGDASLPAARVRPTEGRVFWYLDADAAAELAEASC